MEITKGCFIRWGGETFKVLRFYEDTAEVMTSDGRLLCNFRFTYDGEAAVKIVDPAEILVAEREFCTALTWRYCASCTPRSQEDCEKCWAQWKPEACIMLDAPEPATKAGQ